MEAIKTNDHRRSVTSLIQARHSTRGFLPKPVPMNLVEECLSLAQRTSSNSNLQPWRVTVVTGDALKRMTAALTEAVKSGVPSTTPLIPDKYRPLRSQMGHALYGVDGYNVPRTDKKAMEEMRLRNYNFFGAPVAIILSVDSCLDAIDVYSVGLYHQVLVLLFQERGLAGCSIKSVAGYPDVLRKELGIADDMRILCGIGVGYEDPDYHVNGLRQAREPWTDNVTFVSE